MPAGAALCACTSVRKSGEWRLMEIAALGGGGEGGGGESGDGGELGDGGGGGEGSGDGGGGFGAGGGGGDGLDAFRGPQSPQSVP